MPILSPKLNKCVHVAEFSLVQLVAEMSALVKRWCVLKCMFAGRTSPVHNLEV